jgi:hypothetical protein
MSTSSVRALLAAANACVKEAGRADQRKQYRYANALRQSARTALAELDAIRPRAPVAPDEMAKREKARIYAAVVLKGLH